MWEKHPVATQITLFIPSIIFFVYQLSNYKEVSKGKATDFLTHSNQMTSVRNFGVVLQSLSWDEYFNFLVFYILRKKSNRIV